jgi:hypothetical protein
MKTFHSTRLIAAAALLTAASTTTFAQTTEPKKEVGRAGATQISVSGSFTQPFASGGGRQEGQLQLQFGVGQFVTNHVVVQVALLGFGSIGGSDSSSLDGSAGSSAPNIFGSTGLSLYFTPQSVTSGYTGFEYASQLTNRQPGQNGFARGKFGVQTAVSPYASFYIEGAYGIDLSTPQSIYGYTASRRQELSSQFGFRFLF